MILRFFPFLSWIETGEHAELPPNRAKTCFKTPVPLWFPTILLPVGCLDLLHFWSLPSDKILRNAKLRNFAMTVGTRDSRKIIGRYNLTGALEEGQLQNHVAAVDMKLTVKSQERATSENYHQIHTLSLHCQPAWRLVPGQDVCNQARFEDAVGIFPEFIDGNLFDLQKVVGWPGGPGGSTQYTKSERG